MEKAESELCKFTFVGLSAGAQKNKNLQMPFCAPLSATKPAYCTVIYHWIFDLTSIDRFSAGTLSTSPAPASAAWPGRPPPRRSFRSATSTGRGRRQSTSSTCRGDDEMNFEVKFWFYLNLVDLIARIGFNCILDVYRRGNLHLSNGVCALVTKKVQQV